MNEIKHKWKDLLIKRSTRSFVGRDNIIEHFRLNCLDTVPRDLVIVLHGTAGVGKSTAIARLREIANEYNIFSTYVDSSIATPVHEKAILQLMCGIAQQFSSNGIPLTQFDERYHEYMAALHHISEDADAPESPFDVIGGLHDQDSWYKQAWDKYLNVTFSANTRALIRQPVDQLTPVFIHDLNTWAMVKRILLCFDDWHLLEDHMGVWLRKLMLDGELSTRIWVILSVGDTLTADWDQLNPLLIRHELTELTEFEMRSYLRAKGISDQRRVSDIISFSNGLPVLVDLLSAATEGAAGDLALSPLDRYFKWLTGAQRRVVLLASVARCVDARVLESVLGKDGDIWFEWLRSANLLDKKGDFWVYHSALRPQFLSWARREMYGATYAAHLALRAYYLSSDSAGESDLQLPDESVSSSTLEAIYHGLMICESGALRHAILTFIQLVRSNYSTAGELVEIFEQASAAQENPNAVVEWAAVLKELWDAFYAGDWLAAASCCEVALKREAIDAEVKSAVELLYNAIQARFPQPVLDSNYGITRMKDAVTDSIIENSYGHGADAEVKPADSLMIGAQPSEKEVIRADSDSIEIPKKDSMPVPPDSDQLGQPDHLSVVRDVMEKEEPSYETAEEWGQFGDTRLKAEAYTEALNAYNRALELDPALIIAHFGRASAFTRLGDFPSAVQSYEVVLNAEPDNASALRNRAWLHMRQHRFAQALKDYDRAVSLAPDDVSLVCARANVHYRLKDYTNALKGYDEAISRDSTYTEAYLNRGVTHAVLQEYRRAIADFNQAITLEPANGYAYHRRGRAFTRLQQFEQAHKDYARALELMPQLPGIYIDMGLLYTKRSDYLKALEAYQQAIVLNPGNATAYYNAACVAALLGDVKEACRKLDTAIELHPPYRQMAGTDLDFSSIRNTLEFQKRVNST